MNALSVLLLFAVEHCVFVSWQHLSLGGHVGLPSLEQLDGAHFPGLITGHGDCTGGQAATENIALPRASAMSEVVKRSVGLCVHQALALGGLRELSSGGRGGANSFGGSRSGLRLDLSLECAIEDRNDVVDTTEATALAQLLRCRKSPWDFPAVACQWCRFARVLSSKAQTRADLLIELRWV